MDAAVFDAILGEIAAGESARNALIAQQANPSTFWAYLAKDAAAAEQYARARVRGLDRMAEEILDIADDSARDIIDTEDGPKLNLEVVARARLRVDSRKWLLSKLVPKKYGDRVDLTHAGPDGGAIVTRVERVIVKLTDTDTSGV